MEIKNDGALRVVVQGFLDSRWIRKIQDVQLDGFYVWPDGKIGDMPEVEFYEFD